MQRQRERFVIYRPPKPSNRLEDFLYKNYGAWAPSTKYSYTMWDIRNQMTPAEAYRHKLATSGALIRMLQRLEWRWQKAFQLWWDMSVRVQAGYRGLVARKYYRSVKTDLLRIKEQREAKRAVVKLFADGKKDEALVLLSKVEVMSTELWAIKIKILYSRSKFSECAETCKMVLEIDPLCEEAHYCLSCIYCRDERYVDAYKQLKKLMAEVNQPSVQAYQLNGLVCHKLLPPRLAEAVDSCNAMVQNSPDDMNALLQRACSSSCAQDWDSAIKDLSLILLYQPSLNHVRCLRARAYTASRQWELATEDYKEVLSRRPDDYTAWYGLEDTQQPYDAQPMVDHDLVNDTALPL